MQTIRTMLPVCFITFLVLLDCPLILCAKATNVTEIPSEEITSNKTISTTSTMKFHVPVLAPQPPIFLQPVFRVITPPPRALSFLSLPDSNIQSFRISARTDHVCGTRGFCGSAGSWCPLHGYECHECRCDDDCFRFGDCCPDKYNLTGSGIPSPIDSCVSVINKTSNEIPPKRYFMRDRCLETSDDNLRYKCESKSSEITPVYSSRSGHHYKNTFCAQCNDADDTIPWLTKETCSDPLNWTRINTASDFSQEVSDNPRCAILYSPPENTPTRECTFDASTMISDCPSGWPEEQDIEDCKLYRHPVSVGKRKTFRNLACAVCNEFLFSRLLDGCSRQSIALVIIEPISAMVRNNLREIEDKETKIECPEAEVYDTYANVCRPLYCPPGKVAQIHMCVDIFTSARALGYKMDFNLVAENPTGALLYIENLSDLFSKYREHSSYITDFVDAAFEKTQIKITFATPTQFGGNTMTEGVRVYNITVRTRLVVKRAVPRAQVENLLLEHVRNGWSLYHRHDEKLEVFRSEWLTKDDVPDILSVDNFNTEREDVGSLSKESKIYRNSLTGLDVMPAAYTRHPEMYIPVNELMDCNLIELSPDEIVKRGDKSIMERASGKVYGSGHYVAVGRSARVCTHFTGKIQGVRTFGSFERIPITFPKEVLERPIEQSWNIPNKTYMRDRPDLPVTISCTSLSLLCILITCIVLAFSSKLHTFSTKNSMALFANLFSAQLFSLIAMVVPVSATTCKFLGAAVHYFWLTTFSWILACCYFMYLILTKPFNRNNASRMYVQFCLGFQLTPLAFVAFYIAGNIIQSATTGYDLVVVVEDRGAQLCFLASKLQYGIGLAVPLGLLILVTLYFLIRALRALRLDATTCLNEIKSDGKLPKAYRAIFVVLVCTWIFGTLSMTISNLYVWYVFIIVNSSLGEFVLYCFLSLAKCGESSMTSDSNPAAEIASERKTKQ